MTETETVSATNSVPPVIFESDAPLLVDDKNQKGIDPIVPTPGDLKNLEEKLREVFERKHGPVEKYPSTPKDDNKGKND